MKPLKNSVSMITFSNIKYNKSQIISFFILITIATMLMNIGISTYKDCSDSFDRTAKKLNAPDGLVTVQKSGCKPEMYDYLKTNDKVKKYESYDVILANISFKYNDGDVTNTGVFMSNSHRGSMGKNEITSKSNTKYSDGIYVPYIFNASGKYELGDKIRFKIGPDNYTFRIQGFFNNIYYGSINLSVVGFYMPDNIYNQLVQKLGTDYEGKVFQYQLKNNKDNRQFMAHYYTKCSELAGNCLYTRAYYSLAKSARNMTSNVGGTLIIAFSIIILIVSLIVVKFRIDNSIDEDMTSIGAMKATGYTTNQIRLSYLLQFSLITIAGIITGLVISIMVIPLIAHALSSQSGMIWNNKVNVLVLLFVIITILMMVIITVLTTTYKINHIYPIIALRNGIDTHNFKKNHLPIASSHGNIHLILGLKNVFQNMKQNIIILIIMIATTFSLGFAGVLYYNISVNPQIFIDAVVGEVPDIQLVMHPDKVNNSIITDLNSDKKVENAIYWNDGRIVIKDSFVYMNISDDFDKAIGRECYKGRYPKHDNEIAIGGAVAQDIHKDIGDTITCSYGENEYSYIITGLVQSSSNLGYVGKLTINGYKHINKTFSNNMINVYLKKETSASAYVSQLQKKYGNDVDEIINMNKTMNGMFGMYTNLVTIIGLAILIITCLIDALILYLLIKSYIIRSKTELGIQKALGYTSFSLIMQIMLSFIPVVITGILIGAVLTKLSTNSFLCVVFRSLGVMRLDFVITPLLLIIVSSILIVFSILIVLLVSQRIRKISSISLITE